MNVLNITQPVIAPPPGPQDKAANSPTFDINNPPVTTANPASDSFSITSDKTVIVQKVVTQQVSIALNISTGTQTGNLVDDVLQKISDDSSEEKNTEHLSDDEHRSNVVKNVRVQIDQGIQRATAELDRIGITGGTVAADIGQTRSQLNQAIDQPGVPVAGNTSTNTAETADVQSTAVNAAAASRDLTSSLSITTKEGDVVTIDLNRSQALTAGSINTADSSLVYAGASSSSQLSFSVQGELSEKENEAIEKVIKRVNELAEKLFDGKTGAALEKLGEVNINTKQLAGMALTMSSSISFAAVSAYSQVSNTAVDAPAPAPAITPAEPDTTSAPVAAPVSGSQAQEEAASVTAKQAVDETAAVVKEVEASDSFENPFKELRKIFADIADGLIASSPNGLIDNQNDFIKQLFNDVVDISENDHDADDGEDEKGIDTDADG